MLNVNIFLIKIFILNSFIALTLCEKQCLTKICSPYQFCSKTNSQCENCDVVCTETSHNYDKEICTKQCQDYQFDLRYIKSSQYKDDIKSMKNQLKINLILSSIVLFLIIGIYSVKLIRWGRRHDCLSYLKIFKKKSSQQKPPGNFTHQNPHTQSPKMLNRNNPKINNINERASTVFSVTGTEADGTIKTVSTPLSGRHPAEDSTLDFSYDNAGLSVTPVHEKPKGTETTF